VQRPQEKHDEQERRYHHLAANHFSKNKAIKTGAECQYWFNFALKLIKD
jgi:hypothetical protein